MPRQTLKRFKSIRIIFVLIFLTCAVGFVWAVNPFGVVARRKHVDHSWFENESEAIEALGNGEKGDVDAGRFGRGASFKDYFQRREQMVELLRGLPFTFAIEARTNAIKQLEQQQANLLKNIQT